MNRKTFFYLLFIISGIGYSIYNATHEDPYWENFRRETATTFDTAEIVGRIKYVNRSHFNGHGFTMENEPLKEYGTVVTFLGKYRGVEFKSFAKPGDSIIKHRYSDTLILIKEGKKYYCKAFVYKFKK